MYEKLSTLTYATALNNAPEEKNERRMGKDYNEGK